MFYVSGSVNVLQGPMLAAAGTTSVANTVTNVGQQALDFMSGLSAAEPLAGRVHGALVSLASFAQNLSPFPIGNLPPTACGIFIGGVAGGIIGIVSAPSRRVLECLFGLGSGQLVDEGKLTAKEIAWNGVGNAIIGMIVGGVVAAWIR